MTRHHVATTTDGRRIFVSEDPFSSLTPWTEMATIEQHPLPGVTSDTLLAESESS